MAVPRCKWMAAPPHAPTRRQQMIWVPSCSPIASWRGGSEVTAAAWRGRPRCQLPAHPQHLLLAFPGETSAVVPAPDHRTADVFGEQGLDARRALFLYPLSPCCSPQTVPVRRQGAAPRSAPLAAEPSPALLSLLPPTRAKATFGGSCALPSGAEITAGFGNKQAEEASWRLLGATPEEAEARMSSSSSQDEDFSRPSPHACHSRYCLSHGVMASPAPAPCSCVPGALRHPRCFPAGGGSAHLLHLHRDVSSEDGKHRAFRQEQQTAPPASTAQGSFQRIVPAAPQGTTV